MWKDRSLFEGMSRQTSEPEVRCEFGSVNQQWSNIEFGKRWWRSIGGSAASPHRKPPDKELEVISEVDESPEEHIDDEFSECNTEEELTCDRSEEQIVREVLSDEEIAAERGEHDND